MKKVAIIGTKGIPADYGGFETLAQCLTDDKSVEYTVFCSSKDLSVKLSEYNGAKLRYIPLRANGFQSIPYDICSLICALKGYDVVLVLGVSGAIFLPIFRLLSKSRVVVNIDGLEHRRDKWNTLTRLFLKFSERLAVYNSDCVVADNKGIADYVVSEYGITPQTIAYGGDHAIRSVSEDNINKTLDDYKVKRNGFSLSICRIEPENNCHITLQAAAITGERLLFIGNWNRSEYGQNLRAKYSQYPNITLADPVYNLDTLYALRVSAARYIHGHSAGGTNPSLVEAMFFGCQIFAYDVVYNRETTANMAEYFTDVPSLATLLNSEPKPAPQLYKIAQSRYCWDTIRSLYKHLF